MSFKDMPLDTTLQKGDVVTITGPGEHDLVVREVTGVRFDGTVEVAGLIFRHTSLSSFLDADRALTRVQRPVPALPTVEGDYMLTQSNGYRSFVSLRDGAWVNGFHEEDDAPWLTGCLDGGATLTRVIPADEAKHPEVDVEMVIYEYLELSLGSWKDDFREVMRRVLEGEFDL